MTYHYLAASEANDIRRHDYQLIITAPDGTTETKSWARIADTTGVQSTSFTPTMIGTYNFTFNYPDQKYTWTTAQGGSAAYANVTFLGCQCNSNPDSSTRPSIYQQQTHLYQLNTGQDQSTAKTTTGTQSDHNGSAVAVHILQLAATTLDHSSKAA